MGAPCLVSGSDGVLHSGSQFAAVAPVKVAQQQIQHRNHRRHPGQLYVQAQQQKPSPNGLPTPNEYQGINVMASILDYDLE